MADTSAFDQPEARGLRLIVASLRVIVAAQCFGAAGLRLLNPGTSNIAAMLAAGGKFDYETLVLADRVTGGLLVVCGMFSLTRPCWPLLGPLMLYFFSESVAKIAEGENWLLYVEPLEHAARMFAPLALMLVDWFPPASKFSLWRFMTAGSIIRTAAAATFLGHGVVALVQSQLGGQFVTLIQDATWFLAERSLPDVTAQGALAVIGAVDVAVGLNLIVARSRPVAAWMVLWGFITAGSRVFHFGGFEGVFEVLIRFANGGAPFVVLLYWTLSMREQQNVILPKKTARA